MLSKLRMIATKVVRRRAVKPTARTKLTCREEVVVADKAADVVEDAVALEVEVALVDVVQAAVVEVLEESVCEDRAALVSSKSMETVFTATSKATKFVSVPTWTRDHQVRVWALNNLERATR
ncbi:hypothetical protein Pcac1_g26187 [Phytophthora cactorum]|uniref:Uncharacterized protein n=2 Tax=Phytophthora cactorum TaxID=29920 RepID=A0A329SR94_9STRA|nr:hypothetical protein Pcac1_g26187 [Phytophthora cactorum]RAW39434.1 hypothetical protein PC110_g4303 [Phytophthora cactorum]